MDISWDIYKAEDQTFKIIRNGNTLHEGVPDVALEKYLDPYGIIGDRYEKVRCQLSETGRARVTIPAPGKSEQV